MKCSYQHAVLVPIACFSRCYVQASQHPCRSHISRSMMLTLSCWSNRWRSFEAVDTVLGQCAGPACHTETGTCKHNWMWAPGAMAMMVAMQPWLQPMTMAQLCIYCPASPQALSPAAQRSAALRHAGRGRLQSVPPPPQSTRHPPSRLCSHTWWPRAWHMLS